MICTLCPRKCGVDRTVATGFCRTGSKAEVATIDGELFTVHRYEEPVISGTRGSGAIFFVGCNLRCVYCQNGLISRREVTGATLNEAELGRLMLRAAEHTDTLSLVTAAHFAPQVAAALQKVRPKLAVPVVYNSSGYESVEALKMFEGLVDVYLPDLKHVDPARAKRYSAAADYPDVARAAIAEMSRQVGNVRIENGIMRQGVLIRHLVLPNGRAESIAVMREIAARFPSACVSVMRQYTPSFCPPEYPEIARKVTAFEYESVVDEAARLGLKGFMQEAGCASANFTPNFTPNG